MARERLATDHAKRAVARAPEAARDAEQTAVEADGRRVRSRGAPPWVRTAPMWSDRKGEALLSVAPDLAMVLHLDPGEGAGILDAAEIALVPADMLRGVGLHSRAKTTGSEGMHGHVPLDCPVAFDATEAFARHVAEVMAARMADRVVARVDKRLRAGRLLVDWSQNDRHKSTVDEALDRVAAAGDRFAPALSLGQRLP